MQRVFFVKNLFGEKYYPNTGTVCIEWFVDQTLSLEKWTADYSKTSKLLETQRYQEEFFLKQNEI